MGSMLWDKILSSRGSTTVLAFRGAPMAVKKVSNEVKLDGPK